MLDELMDRTWKKGYTCHEFACEAWKKITGKELTLKKRKPIKQPKSPCIVFLYNNERSDSHVGIFYQGRVIHLGVRGVQYVPLECLTIGFRKVSFYK